MTLLSSLLETSFSESLPELNSWLMSCPLLLPTKLFGILAIQGDPAVVLFDNYIELDFKIKYQPPEETVPNFYEKYTAADRLPQTYSEKDVY